jgi:hypothetical protein
MDREEAFEALVGRARGCVACPRMEGRTRVLSRANGPVGARVMFVAEAPGRLGADAYSPMSLGAGRGNQTYAETHISVSGSLLINSRTHCVCNPIRAIRQVLQSKVQSRRSAQCLQQVSRSSTR